MRVNENLSATELNSFQIPVILVSYCLLASACSVLFVGVILIFKAILVSSQSDQQMFGGDSGLDDDAPHITSQNRGDERFLTMMRRESQMSFHINPRHTSHDDGNERTKSIAQISENQNKEDDRKKEEMKLKPPHLPVNSESKSVEVDTELIFIKSSQTKSPRKSQRKSIKKKTKKKRKSSMKKGASKKKKKTKKPLKLG